MDSPTERMPIACVHCAKAKAKCDKKVSHLKRNRARETGRLGFLLGQTTCPVVGLCCLEFLNCIRSLDTFGKPTLMPGFLGAMLQVCEQTDSLSVEGHTAIFP